MPLKITRNVDGSSDIQPQIMSALSKPPPDRAARGEKVLRAAFRYLGAALKSGNRQCLFEDLMWESCVAFRAVGACLRFGAAIVNLWLNIAQTPYTTWSLGPKTCNMSPFSLIGLGFGT